MLQQDFKLVCVLSVQITVNQKFIQMDYHVGVKKIVEYVIHEGLEGHRGVSLAYGASPWALSAHILSRRLFSPRPLFWLLSDGTLV